LPADLAHSMSLRSPHPSILIAWLLLGLLPAALVTAQTQGNGGGIQSPQTNGSKSANTQASAEEVQAKLNEVMADAAMDAVQKERLTATYRATLEALKAYTADTEKVAKLAQAAVLSADKLTLARDQVKSTSAVFTPPDNVDRLTLEELRQRRSESEAELAAARLALQTLDALRREREAMRAQLPQLIADARAAIDTLEASPIPSVEDDPQGTLKAAREAERAARRLSLGGRLDALVQEQLTIDAEEELLPAQIEIAEAKVKFAGQQLAFWSEVLSEQKQYRIENDLVEHRNRLESLSIESTQSKVLTLQDEWMDSLRHQSRLVQRLTREQSRYTELSDIYKSTKADIESDIASGRGLRSGLGLKLQMTKNRLPSSSDLNSDIRAIDAQIDEARALQTVLDLALEDVNGDVVSGMAMRMTDGLPMIDGKVDPNEISLLKRVKADIDQHVNLLIELKNELERKGNLFSDIRMLIDSHIIWIRSANRYQWSDLATAWRAFHWIVQPAHLKSVLGSLLAGLSRRFDLILLWVVFGLGLWCAGSRLRRRLRLVGTGVSPPGQLWSHDNDLQDSLKPTLIALFITIVLAVPPVATFAVIGYAILEVADKEHFLTSVGSAFLMVAVALFPMETLRQMLRPDGLAIAHFGYRSEIVMPPRTGLRLLIDLGLPMMLIWRIASEAGRTQMEATLGRLIFSIGMIVLSLLLWKSLHPKTGLLADYLTTHPDGWATRLRRVWHPFLSILPAALAWLSLLGYSYTATLFTGKLYWTLWLGIAVLVTGGLLRRWFETYRRRTMVLHSQNIATEQIQLEDGAIEVPKEEPIDMEEMNAQSLRLIAAFLWVIGIVGIFLIWGPLFPAVRIFDQYHLWKTTAADGSIVPITLTNLLLAIPIILLSIAMVRNVPGLLESVLLERLPLDRPARYAITTLASYALALIGILMLASTLGLRWDGIQWLVAALGVGLGFGLQEIFANFVSGLILLFEQPIRVGDVVTIDGVTGTVSRIRIRATAVTNYDRQELIIPNKDLITGRLINWTLTDSTNRLVLNIGIAYGSDTRKACRMLEEICAQHENLLVDPPPVVTFEGFGDSTLNLVVRCFLGALDKRLATIHELNTTINERFNHEGIEIAFPQRDLHIRTVTPDFAKFISPKVASETAT
jgi:potassium efflux system protein